MGKVRKEIKCGDINTVEDFYNYMHDKSVYEVEYPGGKTKKLTANIIDENMLSQVDSVVHHYQVWNVVTDHNRYDRYITKVNGFIKSINKNLH